MIFSFLPKKKEKEQNELLTYVDTKNLQLKISTAERSREDIRNAQVEANP